MKKCSRWNVEGVSCGIRRWLWRAKRLLGDNVKWKQKCGCSGGECWDKGVKWSLSFSSSSGWLWFLRWVTLYLLLYSSHSWFSLALQDDPVTNKISITIIMLLRFNIIISISIIKISWALVLTNNGQCVINQALRWNWWNRPQHGSLPAFTTYRALCWNQIMSKLPFVAKNLDKCFGFQFSPERERGRVFCQEGTSQLKQIKTILGDNTDDSTLPPHW